MKGSPSLILVALLVFLAGCACKPPRKEFTLARTALNAAKQSGARKFASGDWHEAEEAYRRGAKLYKENDYCNAKKVLLTSMAKSERAENATRLKKFQSGEVAP